MTTMTRSITRMAAVSCLVNEEPNDTTLIAQILDPGFAGDCVIVKGDL